VTAPDIFLSYTREDQAMAKRFAEAFEAQGFSVWWDVTLRSGQAYDEVTEEALKTARAVVVLWSKKSVVSRWVRAEATLADRNRTFVPARIEACDLPIMFELTQTADLSRWIGAANDPAWRTFLDDVQRIVARGGTEPPQTLSPVAQGPPKATRATLTTLAVLPFINRSGNSEDDDFADVMFEDLTAALSVGGRYLTVIAASAAAVYRGGARDLRQIGRDLNVLFLLEGNVRRLGADLRLSVQLVEAETGKILWMKKFDRPLTELFALQDSLVAEVSALVRLQVERAEIEYALKNRGNITPEESVLRSTQYANSGTRWGWEAAVAESRRTVELNPDNGLAYAHLAGYQAFLLHHRGSDDPDLVKEVLGNIARARTLDGNNRTVLESIATALTWLRKPQEALPYAERAVAMGANIAASHQILGMVLAMLGRSEEAIAEFDSIERLFPNSVYANFSLRWRSVALLRTGQREQALETAERALRILPGVDTLIQTVLCHLSLGDRESARNNLRRLRELDPEMSSDLSASLVRDVYSGWDALDEHVARIRKIWDETGRDL
jgi:TolB-like protein